MTRQSLNQKYDEELNSIQNQIASLGEIKLPVHASKLQIEKISKEVQAIITEKANLRERAMKLYKN